RLGELPLQRHPAELPLHHHPDEHQAPRRRAVFQLRLPHLDAFQLRHRPDVCQLLRHHPGELQPQHPAACHPGREPPACQPYSPSACLHRGHFPGVVGCAATCCLGQLGHGSHSCCSSY